MIEHPLNAPELRSIANLIDALDYLAAAGITVGDYTPLFGNDDDDEIVLVGEIVLDIDCYKFDGTGADTTDPVNGCCNAPFFFTAADACQP